MSDEVSDSEMPRCQTCGHVEDFHDDGTGARGTWCLALNCGCGEWTRTPTPEGKP